MVTTVGEMQGCGFSEKGEAGATEARGARGGSSTSKGSWSVRSLGGRQVSVQAPLLSRVLCLPLPLKHRANPVTSVLEAEWTCGPTEGEGLWAPAISLARSGLGGPLSREWESWPEWEQGREGLVPCDTLRCPLTWGACPGQGELHEGSRRGRGAAVGLHTQQLSPARQEVSPRPQPRPWRGPTSWKAVRHLSLPRKPGRRWRWMAVACVSLCAWVMGPAGCCRPPSHLILSLQTGLPHPLPV